MATSTEGFQIDGLSVATADSMGVQFLIQAVDASMRLHSYRYRRRQEFFRRQYPHMSTIGQWLHALLESKRKGKGEEENDEEEGLEGEAQREEPEGAGWTTDEDEEDWAKRFLEEDAGGSPDDSSDDEEVWLQHDDINCTL